MKVLLAYLFFALFLGMRAAHKRDDGSERDIPHWLLLTVSLIVGAAFLSLRVIG
jgi:hypothetical protein